MSKIEIKEAIRKLNDEEVVALPTETVYGLAARCDSEEALGKIFSTKKRPFFDPLILHVQNLHQAEGYGFFDSISRSLAEEFWPGALTLVLRKTERVSPLVNNGGETVALRSPQHPLFLEVLQATRVPLAAPSANLFGKTSPTNAEHVIKEFNSLVPVLDGGPCERGIESTVIEVRPEQKEIHILRSGLITEVEMGKFLNEKDIEVNFSYPTKDNAPGFLKNHYQPSAPFLMVLKDSENSSFSELEKILPPPFSLDTPEMSLPNDPVLAARKLYSELRSFSEAGEPFHLISNPLWNTEAHWRGLLDRLEKASHLLAREKKGGWTLQEKGTEEK
jgi:L-threonylcarbamoyladenylate synthase